MISSHSSTVSALLVKTLHARSTGINTAHKKKGLEKLHLRRSNRGILTRPSRTTLRKAPPSAHFKLSPNFTCKPPSKRQVPDLAQPIAAATSKNKNKRGYLSFPSRLTFSPQTATRRLSAQTATQRCFPHLLVTPKAQKSKQHTVPRGSCGCRSAITHTVSMLLLFMSLTPNETKPPPPFFTTNKYRAYIYRTTRARAHVRTHAPISCTHVRAVYYSTTLLLLLSQTLLLFLDRVKHDNSTSATPRVPIATREGAQPASPSRETTNISAGLQTSSQPSLVT